MLLDYFLRRLNRRYARQVSGFTERAMDILLGYRWPGNVRELENVIERAVILADPGGAIDVSHLPTVAQAQATVRRPDRGGLLLGAAGATGPAIAAAAPAAAGSPADSPDAARQPTPAPAASACATLEAVQVALMRSAIERHHGNLTAAARDLGITRPQLAYRTRKLDLWDMRRKRS